MKKSCDCYHIESKRKYTYHPIIGDPIRHDISVGVCWGTKETDECNCGGDMTKCDFYPEVRAKARRKTEKTIKVKTNADDIRSMNDKELAEFLMSRWFVNNVCKNCESEYGSKHYRCDNTKFCESKTLEWLLKEKQ